MKLLLKVFVNVALCCSLAACAGLKQQHLQSQALLSSIDSSVKSLDGKQEAASSQLMSLQQQQVDTAERLKLLDDQLVTLQQSIIDAELLRQTPYQPIELVEPIASVDDSPEVISAVAQAFSDKMVVGRVEWIWVAPLNYYMKARIDSGANVSVFVVDESLIFERDGKKWLRLKVKLDDDGVERNKVLERPVQRYVKVKDDDNNAPRPVISLLVNVGSVAEEIEFFVTERSNATYPIILGKNFLTDIALVDVAQKFIYPRDDNNLQITAKMFAKMRTATAPQVVPVQIIPAQAVPVPQVVPTPTPSSITPINVPTE